MKLPLFSFLILFSAFTGKIYAECGIGEDPFGRSIPAPTGNIPYLKVPDSLCGGSGEYTWDYSGTLTEFGGTRISFQASLAQLARLSTTGAAIPADPNTSNGLGMSLSNIGFSQGGAYFYAINSYGGESNIPTALLQTLGSVTSTSSLTNFSLKTAGVLSNPNWSVTTQGLIPVPPIYLGYVGQPGHQYQMTGTGTTFLWRYAAGATAGPTSRYSYSVTLSMVDERGATMEGLGGGYFGPSLVDTVLPSSYNTEAEIAQPRLRVTNWTILMTAIDPPPPGYEATYALSGTDGMLWNDYGPVLPLKSQVKQALMTRSIPNVPPEYTDTVSSILNDKKGPKGLYNGNWIPVCFTSGKYNGSCLVTATFWTQYKQYPKGQNTNDPSWSNLGFQVLYTGVIPNKVASASSLLETLYPENPNPFKGNQPTSKPPYSVSLDTFVPPQYGMAFPWVQEATITVKARSKIRYALASYAKAYFPDQGADDPRRDLVIKVKAISPVTQNTLFSSSVSQYYEGAAIPTINNREVGFSWLEHMVCPNITQNNACQ